MPFVTTDDGVRLHCEEAGHGPPVVFVHEFGGNHASWEPQLRFFARRHRCVTFAARGYPPSDVPAGVAAYSQARATDDIRDVMDGLGLDRAHVVGLSMGGFAAAHFGIRHPTRALSLVIAGAGYGAEKHLESYFRGVSEEVAANFERLGAEAFSHIYGAGASRVQFQNKDPRGWEAFRRRLGTHDAKGAANTMRGVQARRPSLFDLEAELRRVTLPTLIVNGDEDDHCLATGLFLKRTMPASGLLVLPKTGHTINLEEPAAFNAALAEFFAQVAAGAWGPRDPRAAPEHVMRTR